MATRYYRELQLFLELWHIISCDDSRMIYSIVYSILPLLLHYPSVLLIYRNRNPSLDITTVRKNQRVIQRKLNPRGLLAHLDALH
jgi:hypothetical protein